MKVLVIRFSSLGDIVLTTPVVRVLQNNLDAKVHYLTKSNFSGLLKPNPHITKVYSIKKSVNEVIGALKQEKYDYIIDLHLNLRSIQTRLHLRTVKTLSYQKYNFQKWKMVKLKRFPKDPSHIVDRYLGALTALKVHNDNKGLEFHFDRDLDLSKIQNLVPDRPFGVFVIGAAHFTKVMPKEKFLEVMMQFSHPMVIIGGPSELETGLWLQKQLQKPVYNLCGKLSIQESAMVVNLSKVVVSHDTGFMHIAAALKKPLVTIWGGSVSQMGYWPYYGNQSIPFVMIEDKQLSCRPCSRFGKDHCPKKHFNCMHNLSVELIATSANQFMSLK